LVLDWQPLWVSILDDLKKGISASAISTRFHSGIIQAVTNVALRLCKAHTLKTVALSGGVFQNRIILEGVSQGLRQRGLTVICPHLLPANDGGLSLGQAVVVAAQRLLSR
jgi:hydrogenase maturation protein HypF